MDGTSATNLVHMQARLSLKRSKSDSITPHSPAPANALGMNNLFEQSLFQQQQTNKTIVIIE